MSIVNEKKLSLAHRIKRNTKEQTVQITIENVARVEAMIYENSYYKNKSNDSSFDLINKLTDKNYNKQSIKNIVEAIDRENRTHLNSDYRSKEKHGSEKAFEGGREAVTCRLAKYSFAELKELLKNKDNTYKLFNEIAFPANEKENNHFSFASKFCHNLCMVLFEGTKFEDLYCKYDTVLENALPLYYKEYCKNKIKPKDYKNNYPKYIQYVDEIIECAKIFHGDSEKVSRNGFDHLVWYCHKG